MKKSVFWPGVCILVVAMAVWAACGGTKAGKDDKDKAIDPNSVGTAQITMALTSGVICGEEIVKAQVEISAADMTTITQELTVDKTAAKITGTVKDIPFGLERKFDLKAYDKDDKVLYEGFATAEVKRKETVDVKITAYSTEHCITVGDANINGELVDQKCTEWKLIKKNDMILPNYPSHFVYSEKTADNRVFLPIPPKRSDKKFFYFSVFFFLLIILPSLFLCNITQHLQQIASTKCRG